MPQAIPVFLFSNAALITANELLCIGVHDSNATMHLLIEAFYFLQYTKQQSSKTNNANCIDRPLCNERHLEKES